MAASPSAFDFAAAARTLGAAVRERGLVSPSYRSPPRVIGVDRALRRHDTGAVVSVRVKDRPWPAVVGDMIEGVIVTNRLVPPGSGRLRTELWKAVHLEAPSLKHVA